jgi:plasmid replication initiation protein
MRKLENIDKAKNDTVAVSNRYALSKKMSLSPLATKLFIWCVSQIKKTDQDLITFTLSADDYKSSLGSKKNVNRDLDRVTDELMNFQIHLKDTETGKWRKVNVMSESSYDPITQQAKLIFNAAIWDCFTKLESNFSSGIFEPFAKLNDRFAFNLYIFLHNYLKQTNHIIDIVDFCDLIGAKGDTYSKWAQLNSKILQPLVTYFDEHSKIKFKCKPAGKVGRKYTKIQFYDIRKGEIQGQLLDETNPCKKIEESNDQKLAKSFWETLSDENKEAVKETLKEKGEPAAMLEYEASAIMSLANHPELIKMEPV